MWGCPVAKDSAKSKLIAGMLKKATKSDKPVKMEFELCPEVLLCPNIPMPLHGVAPRVVLGTKWWDRTRKEAYRSTSFHCIACGVHKTAAKVKQHLEAHEVYEVDYEAGRMKYIRAVPLCYFCHNYIHDGRLQLLLQAGKISHKRYTDIIQHGDAVLKRAGISKLPKRQREDKIKLLAKQGRLASWDDWRMTYGGRVFKPKLSRAEVLYPPELLFEGDE